MCRPSLLLDGAAATLMPLPVAVPHKVVAGPPYHVLQSRAAMLRSANLRRAQEDDPLWFAAMLAAVCFGGCCSGKQQQVSSRADALLDQPRVWT